MAIDPNEFVQSFEAAISKDGLISELRIRRANGSAANLLFPTENAGAFMLGVEQAIATLFEAQRKMAGGKDPRYAFPMAAKRVTRFQGAAASDGAPILSFVFDSGTRLDVTFPREVIRDLINYLEQLDQVSRNPPL